MWHQIQDIRHPAELGKRTRLHLPHQVGAMHLHCGFGDADMAGSLLVQVTGHNMEHDVPLAGAKRVEALPERSQCPLALSTVAIASEAGIDGVKQILITEWLCEELQGTALHRLHRHRHVGVRCDENDRHLPVCSGKLALKLKTTSPRHPHIEYEASNQLSCPLLNRAHCF